MTIPTAPASVPPANRLRIGLVTRLTSLDIRKVTDVTSHFLLAQVFESPYLPPTSAPAGTALASVPPQPVLFDGGLRSEPSAAGASVHSAAVKNGIEFSDGTPLTADLVARSLMRSEGFTSQARAEARGDRVVFTLRHPNARFDHFLSQLCCAIVLEKGGSYFGTGQYVLPDGLAVEKLSRATPVILRRNPRHPEQAKIEELAFIEYGTTAEILEALRKGELDFTNTLNTMEAAELRGFPVTPAILEPNSTGILHFNTKRPALADARIRKALALAIDKREIAAITYEKNPLAYIASGLTPTFMGKDQHVVNYSLRESEEIVKKNGLTLPKRLSLLPTFAPRPYMPNPERAARALLAMLSKIGVAVDIASTGGDRVKYTKLVREGEFDLLVAGWIAETPDPADFFEALLASEMIPTAAKMTATSNNLSRWAHPPMDAALAAFRASPTDASRAAIAKLIADEVPLLPLIHGRPVTVYSRRVRGFVASPLGRIPLANLSLGG